MKTLASAFLLIVLFSTYSNAQTPVMVNGALKVKHGRIVNQNGVPPQLHGVSFSWSIWQGQKFYTPAVVDWLASDFKISIMRAAMAVQPDSGYLQKPEMQVQLIQSVVDEAIKDGIYVLIDWHDHHSNLHVAQSKAFFAMMAKKYAGVPNVIYEIWNEPEAISWDTVRNYAMQIIPEIRKYDPNGLIIVGSSHWDQDVDIAAADPVTGFSNIAYSFHFYASDPNHQQQLRDKADLAIKKGLPLLVTEWGVGEASGDGKFDEQEVNAWMQWLTKNKLCWTNWNITDKHETTALLLPGASVNGGWTTDQLTPAGNYIRTEIRKLNTK